MYSISNYILPWIALCTFFHSETLSGQVVVVSTACGEDPVVLEIDSIANVSAASPGGSIFMSISGGVPPYKTTWTFAGQEVSTEEDLKGVGAGFYRISVLDNNDCTVTIDSIEIQLLTSFYDHTLKEELVVIDVYPNPGASQVAIQWGEAPDRRWRISVHDSHGNTFVERDLTRSGQRRLEIETVRWPPGFYFVRLTDGQVQKTKRLVIP